MGRRARTALITTALVAVACSSRSSTPVPAPATGDHAITIASFDFGESEILAELYAQAFERAGIRVIRQHRLGPREFVQPALQQGLVELVPEYAGSLLEFLTRRPSVGADLGDVRDDLRRTLESRGLVPLRSAPAEDENGFAVTLAFAGEHGIDSLSELAALGPITLGGPTECEARPLCGRGLRETYGVSIDRFVRLDASGPLTDDALRRGLVDVALVLTTSPILEAGGLLLLADDRGLQPAENVTPVVHASVLDRFPDAGPIADGVSAELTTEDLRHLNTLVEVDGISVAQAAAGWLDAHGLPSGED